MLDKMFTELYATELRYVDWTIDQRAPEKAK